MSLFISLTVVCAATAQTPGAPAGDKPWFERCIVGMEVGTTGAQFGYSDLHDTQYASRFNGRDIVRKCVEANVEYLVIWTRDGDWAYYDSKIAASVPDWATRDVLRETVEEASQAPPADHRLLCRAAGGPFPG